MKTRWVSLIIAISVIIAVTYGIAMFIQEASKPEPTTSPTAQNLPVPQFTSSSPGNDEILPANIDLDFVTISFDTTLTSSSTIDVVHQDGTDATTGPLQVQGATLRTPVSLAQTGEYTVHYKGCDTAGSCTQGTFEFVVKAD